MKKILLAIASALIISCSNDENESNSEIIRNYNLSIDISKLHHPVFEEKLGVTIYPEYFTDQTIFQNKIFTFIKQDIKKDIPENIAGIAIHMKRNKQKINKTIDLNSIDGYTIYYTTNENLKTRIFEKTEKGFEMKFDLYSNGLSLTHLMQMKSIHSKNKLSDYDFKIIVDNTLDWKDFKKGKNEYPLYYNYLKRTSKTFKGFYHTSYFKNPEENNDENNDDPSTGGYVVSADCSMYGGYCVGASYGNCDFVSSTCDANPTGPCPRENPAMFEVHEAPSPVYDREDIDEIVLNESSIEKNHLLRDNILSNSERGQLLIEDYYAISNYVDEDEIDVVVAGRLIIDLPTVDAQIEKLLDSGYNSEIIIDQNLSSSLSTTFTRIKNNSQSQYLNYTIDRIISEIESFEGQTKQNVLNAF